VLKEGGRQGLMTGYGAVNLEGFKGEGASYESGLVCGPSMLSYGHPALPLRAAPAPVTTPTSCLEFTNDS
jgi:hypothetical protein